MEREKYKFETVQIVGHQLEAGSGQNAAFVQLAFAFGKVTEKVTLYNPDGSLGVKEQYYWDQINNKGGTGSI